MHERLEARAELRGRTSDALGDGPHAAVLAGEQGHDPVGLAQLLRAQDDAVIAVQAHRVIVAYGGSSAGQAEASSPIAPNVLIAMWATTAGPSRSVTMRT